MFYHQPIIVSLLKGLLLSYVKKIMCFYSVSYSLYVLTLYPTSALKARPTH